MRLRFFGANRQVTGSRHLLEAAGLRIMVDCGMFQERCCLERNWATSPIPPGDVDVLLLTHAHLDHCGLIPRFAARGFAGTVLATAPSIDLARIVLEDSARIQEEDVATKKRRHRREGRRGPHEPEALHTVADVERAMALFKVVAYDRRIELGPGAAVTYRDAGHILGSAILELDLVEDGTARRVVFSGDLGQSGVSLTHDPAAIERADVVVMESTYGDRDHERGPDVSDHMAEVINDTARRGGNVIVPTFAIDRAQDLMFMLGQLVREDRIPHLTIFLDSPMAISATTIYKRFKHLLDEEAQALLDRGEHPFQFPGLHFVRTSRESRAINSIRGTCIVLAGSGMCTGGRVKHHLRHHIDRPDSTVLFTGYQASDTLGRHIVDGDREVRIHGRNYPVRARIEMLSGLSAHADQEGLVSWISRLREPPGRIFLTHGELDAAESLRRRLTERRPTAIEIPDYLHEATL